MDLRGEGHNSVYKSASQQHLPQMIMGKIAAFIFIKCLAHGKCDRNGYYYAKFH